MNGALSNVQNPGSPVLSAVPDTPPTSDNNMDESDADSIDYSGNVTVQDDTDQSPEPEWIPDDTNPLLVNDLCWVYKKDYCPCCNSCNPLMQQGLHLSQFSQEHSHHLLFLAILTGNFYLFFVFQFFVTDAVLGCD